MSHRRSYQAVLTGWRAAFGLGGISPLPLTPNEVRRFRLYLIGSGVSICNRNNRFRVTLRRHDPVAEVWHIKEPQKLPPVLGDHDTLDAARLGCRGRSMQRRWPLSLHRRFAMK